MRSLTNFSTLNVVCDEDCEMLGCLLQVNHKNLSHHCWQTCLKLITDGGHHGYQSTVQFVRQNCPLTSTSGLFWHLVCTRGSHHYVIVAVLFYQALVPLIPSNSFFHIFTYHQPWPSKLHQKAVPVPKTLNSYPKNPFILGPMGRSVRPYSTNFPTNHAVFDISHCGNQNKTRRACHFDVASSCFKCQSGAWCGCTVICRHLLRLLGENKKKKRKEFGMWKWASSLWIPTLSE